MLEINDHEGRRSHFAEMDGCVGGGGVAWGGSGGEGANKNC